MQHPDPSPGSHAQRPAGADSVGCPGPADGTLDGQGGVGRRLRTRLQRSIGVSGLVAWLLLGSIACVAPRGDSGGRDGAEQGAQLAPDIEFAAWQSVQRAEFARLPTLDLLQAALGSDDQLRQRAVLALGRIPYLERAPDDGVTQLLLDALGAPTWEVRAHAAFSLGMRGDPRAASALLAVVGLGEREDEVVRGCALEALSKLDADSELEARIVTAVVTAFSDSSPFVRIEAAIAPHRFERDEGTDPGLDARLVAMLDLCDEAELRWRYLFTLQRRRAALALEAFLDFARSDEALERLFAIRGLARLAPDLAERDPQLARSVERTLIVATLDPDWRVAVEALQALEHFPTQDSVDALLYARDHERAHVRAASLTPAPALIEAYFAASVAGLSKPFELGPLLFWIDELLSDSSLTVRAAALRARQRFRIKPAPLQPQSLAELGFEPGREPWMEGLDEFPELRAANVSALSDFLPTALAVEALAPHTEDSHPLVAGAALAGLGLHLPDSRAILQRYLQHPDNGLRLAALSALGEAPLEDDLRQIELCYLSARGDVAPEIRVQALKVLGDIAADEATTDNGRELARELLMLGASDPGRFVAQTARAQILEHFGAPWLPAIENLASHLAQVEDADLPLYGRELELDGPNPWVALDTNRGTLIFELFPDEAPWHVYNFLTLATDGFYAGLPFHRVVPDFVVQGGDYRGDGHGNIRVGGGSLPHEITPRKYVRGSLGMPRNEDWDSGGSQLFVTHRPTPHLDGRYTIFGELREGWETLDAIEIGDWIQGVRRVRPR